MLVRILVVVLACVAFFGCASSNTKAEAMGQLTRDAGLAYVAGNCTVASEMYKKIVAKVPNETASRLKIANCANFQGDRAGAIAQYKEILVTNPDYAAAWFNLSFVQLQELAETLAKLIENVVPSTDAERALVDLSMALLSTYNQSSESLAASNLDSEKE